MIILTVQQLIDILNKAENKSLPVLFKEVGTSGGGYTCDILEVKEYDTFVIIEGEN
jgi:hypothetical protein